MASVLGSNEKLLLKITQFVAKQIDDKELRQDLESGATTMFEKSTKRSFVDDPFDVIEHSDFSAKQIEQIIECANPSVEIRNYKLGNMTQAVTDTLGSISASINKK